MEKAVLKLDTGSDPGLEPKRKEFLKTGEEKWWRKFKLLNMYRYADDTTIGAPASGCCQAHKKSALSKRSVHTDNFKD